MVLKRVYVLIPVLAVILGCWVSSVSVLTVIVRQNRIGYMTSLLFTWWDLGRSILAFWGGTFKLCFYLVSSFFALVRMLGIGFWIFLQDILFLPFRVIRSLGENLVNPGVPWIAAILTMVWALIEALIFTFVTSSLVIDTLSNLTGTQLTEALVRIPLFLFMLFIILGSYAVLTTWSESLRKKDVGNIVKIGAIELVTVFVEVMFLYREFVDALVPWFAQHSGGSFDLGIVGTLGIAFLVWLGVRGMSWFLFASHGAPIIMALIQGAGLKPSGDYESTHRSKAFLLTINLIEQIQKEMDWIQSKGDEVLSAFILPPLQVVAAAINFCTLLFSGQHLFSIPFKSMKELMESRAALHDITRGIERKLT